MDTSNASSHFGRISRSRTSSLTFILLVTALVFPSATLADPPTAFYEVNLRASSDTGDLKGAEQRLPAIAKLGADIVWLMPIYPVGKVRSAGGLGSPYSVADYNAVNPEFGNLADLQRYVRRAHALGLRVILDWVGNHTSWDNPWIALHKDWYRQNEYGHVIIPPGTGWNDVAQLDHSNPEMRHEMERSMEFWIDTANVDGFRCDAADYVPESFWTPLVTALRSHAAKKLLMLAEGSRPDLYASGFDYEYAWDFCTALKRVIGGGQPASRLKEALAKEHGLPKMHYATNHDESSGASPVSLYNGPDGSFVAFALAALYGGNPLIYDGEEIAWPEKTPFFDRMPFDWSTGKATERRFADLLHQFNRHESLRVGAMKEFGTDDVVAFTRELNGDSFTVLINVRNTPKIITLPHGKAPYNKTTLAPFEVRLIP